MNIAIAVFSAILFTTASVAYASNHDCGCGACGSSDTQTQTQIEKKKSRSPSAGTTDRLDTRFQKALRTN